jgi:hypothetical protein
MEVTIPAIDPIIGTISDWVEHRWWFGCPSSDRLSWREGPNFFSVSRLWTFAGAFAFRHPWPSGVCFGLVTKNFHEDLFRDNINPTRLVGLRRKCSDEKIGH